MASPVCDWPSLCPGYIHSLKIIFPKLRVGEFFRALTVGVLDTISENVSRETHRICTSSSCSSVVGIPDSRRQAAIRFSPTSSRINQPS